MREMTTGGPCVRGMTTGGPCVRGMTTGGPCVRGMTTGGPCVRGMTTGGPCVYVHVRVPFSIHWVCSPPISRPWSSQEALEGDPRPAPLLATRTLVRQSVRLQKYVMSPTMRLMSVTSLSGTTVTQQTSNHCSQPESTHPVYLYERW